MSCDVILFILYLFIALSKVASYEKCPRGFMDLNTIAAKAPLGFQGFPSTVDELGSEIRIIPEMKFTCSGVIIKIVVGARVRPKRPDHDGCYPQLQIWREPDNNKNQMVFILVSSHEIVLTEDNFNPSGYFKYYFSSHIPFQAGDVIGIYQPSDTSDVQLYYTTLFNTGPTTYTLDIPNGLPFRSTFDLNGQGVTPVEGQRLLLRPETNVSDSCLSNFLSWDTVKSSAQLVNTLTFRDRELRLFPDISFTCGGYITKWIVGGQAIMEGGNFDLPELQVWRMTGTDGNSYIRIHSSFLVPNESTSIMNVHEYYPDPPLQVTAGDIIGLFQPQYSDSQLVVFYQETSGPSNLVVEDIDPAPPTGLSGISACSSENDYPLVTVEFKTILPTTTTSLHSSSSNFFSSRSTFSSKVTSEIPTESAESSSSPSDNTDSNQLIIIISASMGGVIILGIFIVIVILSVMVIVIKKQKRGGIDTPTRPNANIQDEATDQRYSIGYPYYEECVDMKRNFSYGVVNPHQFGQLRPNPAYIPTVSIHRGNENIHQDQLGKLPLRPNPAYKPIVSIRRGNENVTVDTINGEYETLTPQEYILPVSTLEVSTSQKYY